MLRLLVNILWLVFGGLFLAAGYFLAGLVMFILIITLRAITIIGIPFACAHLKLALAVLVPFGEEVVNTGGPGGRRASVSPKQLGR